MKQVTLFFLIITSILSIFNLSCSSTKPVEKNNPSTQTANQNETASNNQNNKKNTPIDVNEVLKEYLPDFRLAEKKDYNKVLLKQDDYGKPIYTADFNADGREDCAVIVVNDKTKEYRIYYILRDEDKYKLEPLFIQTDNKSIKDGIITNPMFFKPIGEAGIGDREYNSLTNDIELPDSATDEERQRARENKLAPYKAVPAVEVWTGDNDNKKSEVNLDSISYCSTTWYYEKGKLKDFNACD
jgi:hypothetical protein